MRILLWKIGALGDVMMTTPLVRQLRRQFPDAQIDYLVGQHARILLDGNKAVSNVIAFDESILVEKQLRRLPGLIAQLSGYDLLFTLDKHWIFGLLAFFSRVPKRVGFARGREGWAYQYQVPYGEIRHEVDYYLDLATAAGVQVDHGDRTLQLPPFTETSPVGGRYVALSNAGGANIRERSSVRRMPDAVFAELVQRLSVGHTVVCVGSAAERSYYDAFSQATNLCGTLSLAETWSVLRRAAAFITTDNGLMHMAGAVTDRIVAVFGPSHPARKLPAGARAIWLDEKDYDSAYEVFGQVPQQEFFKTLSVEAILQCLAQVAPELALSELSDVKPSGRP